MLTLYDKADVEPEAKPVVKNKVERVLKCEEYGRIIDFGLGRGVNATKELPWFNKSSFQVQEVTPHNIVGTEEGGILKSFVSEVWSIEEVKSRFSASVKASEKVSIGIDAELNRSYGTSRRSVGQNLVTRSVAFKPDFELDQEVICSCKDEQETISKEALLPTFEERLIHWILGRVNKPLESKDIKPLAALQDFLEDNSEDIVPFLTKHCLEFIERFSITHYVCTVHLGAAKYEILSEEEYLTQVKLKGKLDVLKFAKLAAENDIKYKSRSKQMSTTEIGRFEDVQHGDTKYKMVERGSVNEAVVAVDFLPISALVHHESLNTAMKQALKDYLYAHDLSAGKLSKLAIP